MVIWWLEDLWKIYIVVETSCDEQVLVLLKLEYRDKYGNLVSNRYTIKEYGVIPEIASRMHAESNTPDECLKILVWIWKM